MRPKYNRCCFYRLRKSRRFPALPFRQNTSWMEQRSIVGRKYFLRSRGGIHLNSAFVTYLGIFGNGIETRAVTEYEYKRYIVRNCTLPLHFIVWNYLK